jgi:uncharacterized membrane protein HdeD (DUF308 family)
LGFVPQTTLKGEDDMITYSLLTGLEEIRQKWGWFLVLGIALVVLGTVALAVPHLATLTSVMLFAWLVILGGVFEAVAAFSAPKWTGILLHLLSGILGVVVGTLIISQPAAGAGALTLLLASFFFVSGFFRIGTAAMLRFPAWGWAVFGGTVTALLGALIWAQWPSSAVWVIGTFVAIDLLVRGWTWIMFAFAARSIQQEVDLPCEPALKQVS